MSWFGNWLLKLTDKARNDECKGVEVATMDENPNFGTPLHIAVYNANGGKIITFRSYDRKTDYSNESIYVIQPEDDLAESLSKLIGIEDIKHAGR